MKLLIDMNLSPSWASWLNLAAAARRISCRNTSGSCRKAEKTLPGNSSVSKTVVVRL